MSTKSKSHELVYLDPLQRYLSEIRQFRLLSPEEEYELAKKFRDTRNSVYAYKLVTANLRLVVKIALGHRSYYQNLLELIQEGNIGLMEAVKRFDPYRGVRLPTYAQWWIRAYILKFILENFSLVKIGTTQAQRKLFFRLKKEQNKLLREGSENDTKLLAERIKVSEKDVVEMDKRLNLPEVSLQATQQSDNRPLIEILPVENSTPEDHVANKEVRERMRAYMNEFCATLNTRERSIWDARIMAVQPQTFQELATQHGITRQRVQQLERRLKRQFHDFLKKKLPEPNGRIN